MLFCCTHQGPGSCQACQSHWATRSWGDSQETSKWIDVIHRRRRERGETSMKCLESVTRKVDENNQILTFFFCKRRRTDSWIRRKKVRPHRDSNPGSLRVALERWNHLATKPRQELCANSRLSPSCQFYFCLIRLPVILSSSVKDG